jgi:hypothetical protein
MKIIVSEKYDKLFYKKAEKVYIGNCINGLDDEHFSQRVADDATSLAQIVENGEEINEQMFFNMVSLPYENIQNLSNNPQNFEYYYNKDVDIAWIYDINRDVEYFYI